MEDPVFESAVLYESIRNPITIELPVQNPLPGSPHVPVRKYIFYSLLQAEENLKAKSLKAFCEKYQPSYAVRTSMSDYREQDWMTNIPLYAIKWIENYVNQ